MRKNHYSLLATGIAVAVLVGCGGTATTPASTSLAGKVIDGYIEGATVCLDLNANQACDANEPSATSAADGSYKLELAGLTTAQIQAAHLLTVVPDTAKDADDGGKTLKEAGKSGFSLLAPAAAYVNTDGTLKAGAVISPLTTLVSHEMISGNTLFDKAETDIRARLALPVGTDLRQDFVEKKVALLQGKAQLVAMAIAEVKKAVLADTASNATEQQSLLAALNYLQTQVAALQIAFDADKKAAPPGTIVTALKSVQDQMILPETKPDTGALVSQAKQLTQSSIAISTATLLKEGVYNAQRIFGACTGDVSSSCVPTYKKITSIDGKKRVDAYYWNGSTWTLKDANNLDEHLTLTGWKLEADCNGGTLTAEGSAAIATCNGETTRLSVRTVDASNKPLGTLNLNLPADVSASVKNTVMPAGAMINWITSAKQEDSYYIFTGNQVSGWDNTNQGDTRFTTLDDLIKAYPTPTTLSSNFYPMGWSGLFFSFDPAGVNQAVGTVSLWFPDAVSENLKQSEKKADYERRTVFGKDILIIKAKAPQNTLGEQLMFAVKDGAVYGGSYRAADIANQSGANFNKIMMDAILKAGDKSAVLN